MKLTDLRFRPSLLDAVKGYRRADFTADSARATWTPTGLDALKGLHRHLERRGGSLVLAFEQFRSGS